MKWFVSVVFSAILAALLFGGVAFVVYSLDHEAIQKTLVETVSVPPPPTVEMVVVNPVESPPETDPIPFPDPEPEEKPERVDGIPVLPFVMNISRYDEGLMLQGSIPSKEIKEEIAAAASSASEGPNVIDRLKYSPETEETAWLAYLPGLVEAFLAHTAAGHEITIVDNRLILFGAVRDEDSEHGLRKLTEPFSENGLKVEVELKIDSSLARSLPKFRYSGELSVEMEGGDTDSGESRALVFYFDTGSSEILPDDREKVKQAIELASNPRSVISITAYADYRGSFELNRKLSLARAERVRDAIFSGEIADDVTAEISAEADTLSEKQDAGKEDDESLRHSRRVEVEVSHSP